MERKTVIFILGTPFCGSTLLGSILNAIPTISFLGEVNRLHAFHQFPNNAYHYKSQCDICQTHEVYDCPVWSEKIVKEVESRYDHHGLLDAYLHLINSVSSSIIVDGSKFPSWLHVLIDCGLLAEKCVSIFCIISSRLPWAFAYSAKISSPPIYPAWRAAEVWRDTYFHAIRICTTYSIPFVVIRYEELMKRDNEIPTLLQRCLSPFSIYVPADVHYSFIRQPVHAIGGNPRVYVNLPSYDVNRGLEKVPEHGFRIKEQIAQNRILTFQEKWRKELSVEEKASILNVPGLVDVAGNLGYDVFNEICH